MNARSGANTHSRADLSGESLEDKSRRLTEEMQRVAFNNYLDAVVCGATDLYGTGRIDLVVGNFSSTMTDHPVTIWKNNGK